MSELHLKAGLFVFAVIAAVLALWLGGAWVGSLIVLAFICGFAGAGTVLGVVTAISKISKMGPL